MTLRISRRQYAQLLALAKTAAPNECCGLLFGQDGRIEEWVEAKNVSANPRRQFEIDPAVLIAAEKRARAGDAVLLGYFHSHPAGRCAPSQTDADMAAADGRYWLIIADKTILAWCAQDNGTLYGRFTPIELERQA